MLPVKLKPNIKSQIEDAELLKKLKAEKDYQLFTERHKRKTDYLL